MKTLPRRFLHHATLIGLALYLVGTTAVQATGKVAAWGANQYGQRIVPAEATNLKAIAAGDWHGLALRADGRVIAWGWNSRGQANVPAGLSNVTAITSAGLFNIALKANGTVTAWGDNSSGQINVPTGLNNVVAVAAGGHHGLALHADGTVTAWGNNNRGQTNVPPGLSNVIAIAGGALHSLALKSDGTLVAWGSDFYGESTVPPGLTNVVAIAAHANHNLALRADGSVAAWGYNSSGQANVPPGLSNVVAVAANVGHSLAIKSDGTVAAWGLAAYGATAVPTGLSNVLAVAAGYDFSLALVFDGPPEIVEQPENASVSYQSNVVFSVVASGSEPLSYRWLFNGYPLNNSARISGVTNASLSLSNAQFTDAGEYSVIVSNPFGVVQSSGAVLTVTSPPIITLQPIGLTVLAGTNITLNAAATGTPPLSYQWLLEGAPIAGATSPWLNLNNAQATQSGNYSLLVSNVYGVTQSSNALITVQESAPYILTQPTNRSAILGGVATFTVTARGSTPLKYQWRFNGADLPGATNATLTLTSLRFDQAGFYTVAVSNSFGSIVSAKAELTLQQIAVWVPTTSWTGFPGQIPPGLTNLIAISASGNFILGLKAEGTVAVWGTPARSLVPTNVPPGLSNVTAIASGVYHCLALRSNGTVVAWGRGPLIRDRLPPYSYSATNSATNVPPGLSNVIAIAAGDTHSLALKADGNVVAWGDYQSKWTYPRPGMTNSLPPGLSNVIAIAVGGAQNLALKADGKVVAWGQSTNVPSNLSNVIAIACNDGYGLGLKADGRVFAWPTIPSPPFPRIYPQPATNVPSTLSNVVAIAAGGYGMALRADGSVATWGSSVPQTPVGLSNVFAISAGANFLLALIGDGAPRFTIQPASQTVTNGAKVQLHARAVGVGPLHYQWQFNGADLPGATTPDLTIANARGRDAGSYRVRVSNGLGVITSSPASLNIPFSTNLALALNAPQLVWSSSPSNAPWFAQIQETHDGDTAAQSGRIGHGQQSVLQTTVVGPGTLTFWWKVSSEEGYDRLWFNVDVMSSIRAISGETDWQQVVMPIPAGSHVVRWVYSKDATVSTGRDAGWVDEVTFTPAAPLVLTAPRLLSDGSLVFDASDAAGGALSPERLAVIEVQASTNLHDWVTLSGACVLTNGALVLRDPDCGNYPSRFYRVVER